MTITNQTRPTTGFFVENHADAPRVERQIAELASGDVAARSAELARRGLNDVRRRLVRSLM